ncbi:MAG TPA: GNAT family protein [Candidatus Limnocylindrales bacterium]|nr:GNAT family protein [Candidatus Limnocylindrales bacterium]
MKILKLNPAVRIGGIRLSHAPTLFRWMRDPVVAGNLGLRQKPSLKKTEDWIRRVSRDATVRPYAISLAGKHVGNVVLDRIDSYLATARLSIYVGEKDALGRGVATAAIYLVLKRAFLAEKLHKVWLTVHVRNTRAIQTYTRIGFVIEGVLRDDFWLGNRRVNALLMSLLRTEFQHIRVVR